MHPLDLAVALQHQENGQFIGHTSSAYDNMVGPFGGVTSAALVQALLQHPQCLGEPVALTVNFAGPLSNGEFAIDARPVRTNRSTQHWMIMLTQGGEVMTSATAVTATRRETWGTTELKMPHVPAPAELQRAQPIERATWTRQYDARFVRGGPDASGNWTAPDACADEAQSSLSQLWIRDEPPRALDFVSLAAICDAFYPRIFVRRPKWVPVGTVSLTTYFHADGVLLSSLPAGHVLGCARAQHFGDGYFDQNAEIWSQDGRLLAASHQVVYYKE
jgi:acyl-coenzyme A thioesterase PaaI-like protein